MYSGVGPRYDTISSKISTGIVRSVVDVMMVIMSVAVGGSGIMVPCYCEIKEDSDENSAVQHVQHMRKSRCSYMHAIVTRV